MLAQSVETDAARSYVTFSLDPAARFSDGAPVKAEDVIFSWQLLRDKGRPNHRTYYAKVAKAEALGEQAVRFDLSGSDDRELALILGLMPVLAKHAVKPETFEETSFQAPLGTGPYLVGEVDPGKSITLKRNPDYWGRDLAINRGLWNFDEVRFDRSDAGHCDRKITQFIVVEHAPDFGAVLLAEREHQHRGALRPFELAFAGRRRHRAAGQTRQRAGDLALGGTALGFLSFAIG